MLEGTKRSFVVVLSVVDPLLSGEIVSKKCFFLLQMKMFRSQYCSRSSKMCFRRNIKCLPIKDALNGTENVCKQKLHPIKYITLDPNIKVCIYNLLLCRFTLPPKKRNPGSSSLHSTEMARFSHSNYNFQEDPSKSCG